MNSPKWVKSGVPERVSIFCPTCGTSHDLPQITGNQSYVTVSEQTIQHTVQITFIFIGQMRLVFGKCVCTCVTKHSNPTCGTSHDLHQITGNQSYVTVSEQTIQHTVQITFIFIGQTRLVFGKCVYTCVTKHSNAFRTFLNWLKNSKRVLHEPKLHISHLPLFANFDL